MSSEKRIRQRVPLTLEAMLQVGESSVGYPRTRDISMSGIYLDTDSPLAVGTKGRVTLELASGADGVSIQADFEVVRNDPKGMAISFTHMDPDSSIHLYNVIKYQSETSHGT